MKTVTVGGATAAVHTAGGEAPGGPDLVLIHGAGFDHNVFRYQTRYFGARGHRVFAVDLPGHGASGGPALGSIAAMGAWLTEAIDALGCEETVLIGHSMGTFVALEAAASGLVRGLVLIGTSDHMSVHPELLAAAAEGDHHAIDLMVGWMHTGRHRYGGHRSAGSWTAGVSRAILGRNLSVLGGDLDACASYDPVPAARRLAVPALVISAGADKMTPASAATRLAAQIDRCSQLVIPDGGHLALTEQPTEVNASIADFLSRLGWPT